jgi:hypothetical protein
MLATYNQMVGHVLVREKQDEEAGNTYQEKVYISEDEINNYQD